MKTITATASFLAMQQRIGLYPIVDTASWVKKLLALQVTTIQLRIKNTAEQALETHIKISAECAHAHNAQLFINDYWQLAIKYQAFGVHLGQEDLQTADLSAIKRAGLRLGISTHSQAEIDIALSHQPSYIAFGPVYHTDTKVMPYLPQGLNKLQACCAQAPCPVVAIGGLNQARIKGVINTGVDGIAVLSAIVASSQPNIVVSELQQLIGY